MSKNLSEVNLTPQVSLAEAADLVQHVGNDVTFVFEGEVGIGKSYMLYELGKRMPEYQCVYAEMPTFDVGDMNGVPFTETINGIKVTRFAPDSMLQIYQDRPVLFMADEVGKTSRQVQNTLLRLFHEKKIGEYALPPNSIVFGTTNLVGEGLGDYLQAHAYNRVSVVPIAKPDANEVYAFGSKDGWHPIILAWMKRFPHCLASYREGEGNPYIHYPHKTDKAFVTGRSLNKASHIMWKRHLISPRALEVALIGCVGAAAASGILSFTQVDSTLATWDSIVQTPNTATVPDASNFAANYITVFSAIHLVKRDTFSAWMTYLKRLPKEYQGVFARNVQEAPAGVIAVENRAFIAWATENHWMA